MRIVVCDRCGRRIQDGEMIGSVAVNMRREYQGPMVKANPYSECDFCEDCMREIVALIDADPYQEPEEEEDETEQEPNPDGKEDEPPAEAAEEKKPASVNLRELRELVKEGKTPQEIADHFGITVQKYYLILFMVALR